jgi:type IV secretory pathway component VirB8
VILEKGKYSKYLPFAFTEQGVAMLSGILNSERAINVNIAIMRAFVQMRRMLETHKELAKKLEELESKYDEQFSIVFEAIRQLIHKEKEPRNPVGFKIGLPPLEG